MTSILLVIELHMPVINIYETLNNFPGLAKKLTCKDLLFTQYECPQVEREQKFYVECSFIGYVISGRRVFRKEEKTWELSEGTCVFVRKGTHIAEKEEGEGWCVMVFFVPDNFLKQLINDNRKNVPMVQLSPAESEQVLILDVNEISKSFFSSMIPYFTQTSPPPEHLLELKFKELVLSLISNKLNRPLLSYLNTLSRSDLHPTVEEVMQNNFTFNLTLAEYAKLACKSTATFKREFKRLFNDSPAKWVTKKRMDMAKALLENTDMTITSITFECGFENQTHFSRVFKEKTGSTPVEFRSRLKIPGR